MVDKALTVHLSNSSPLMICPHYGTELGERIIHHLPFPLVWPRSDIWTNHSKRKLGLHSNFKQYIIIIIL